MSWARPFHVLTFLVALTALVLQLVLVVRGHAVLDESSRPDAATRILRYCSYLTIWSNALVAWSAGTLAFGVDRDTRVWRALRLDAIVICFGGGVVHFFFLRPLLDLHGADLVADKLLHLVVPLLAVVGWVAFGPRGRATRADLAPFLVVPVVWLVYTLVRERSSTGTPTRSSTSTSTGTAWCCSTRSASRRSSSAWRSSRSPWTAGLRGNRPPPSTGRRCNTLFASLGVGRLL